MHRLIRFTVLLLLAALATAQQNKLKVYIAADMEGVGGVSTWEVQASTNGRESAKFRQLMTKEVPPLPVPLMPVQPKFWSAIHTMTHKTSMWKRSIRVCN